MIQNIAVVGIDRDIAYEVSKLIASELDMHFLDTIDLFEFDNKPRTLSDILELCGIRYFREKEKGTLKYVSDFNNSVINLESGMAECQGNFKIIKTNCLVVYLKQNTNELFEKLSKKDYKSKALRNFYCVSEKVIGKRDINLSKNADIVINIDGFSPLKTASEVIRQIKIFFGAN